MKDKILYALVLFILVLTSCEKVKPPTIEEKVLMQAFTAIVLARVYDEECNENALNNTKSIATVYYYGNLQMLSARVGGLWKLRYKDGAIEDGVEFLTNIQKRVQEKAKKALSETGCSSSVAKGAKSAFLLVTTYHPAALYEFFNEQIEKEGGTVTEQAVFDAISKDN